MHYGNVISDPGCFYMLRLTSWSMKFVWTICNNPVAPSQETHFDSITVTSRLMLFMDTLAVCCVNNAEHMNTVGKIQRL